MANMSYCRFENTYQDLKDCLKSLNENDLCDLSKSEREFAIKLVKMCSFISQDFLEDVMYYEEINQIK